MRIALTLSLLSVFLTAAAVDTPPSILATPNPVTAYGTFALGHTTWIINDPATVGMVTFQCSYPNCYLYRNDPYSLASLSSSLTVPVGSMVSFFQVNATHVAAIFTSNSVPWLWVVNPLTGVQVMKQLGSISFVAQDYFRAQHAVVTSDGMVFALSGKTSSETFTSLYVSSLYTNSSANATLYSDVFLAAVATGRDAVVVRPTGVLRFDGTNGSVVFNTTLPSSLGKTDYRSVKVTKTTALLGLSTSTYAFGFAAVDVATGAFAVVNTTATALRPPTTYLLRGLDTTGNYVAVTAYGMLATFTLDPLRLVSVVGRLNVSLSVNPNTVRPILRFIQNYTTPVDSSVVTLFVQAGVQNTGEIVTLDMANGGAVLGDVVTTISGPFSASSFNDIIPLPGGFVFSYTGTGIFNVTQNRFICYTSRGITGTTLFAATMLDDGSVVVSANSQFFRVVAAQLTTPNVTYSSATTANYALTGTSFAAVGLSGVFAQDASKNCSTPEAMFANAATSSAPVASVKIPGSLDGYYVGATGMSGGASNFYLAQIQVSSCSATIVGSTRLFNSTSSVSYLCRFTSDALFVYCIQQSYNNYIIFKISTSSVSVVAQVTHYYSAVVAPIITDDGSNILIPSSTSSAYAIYQYSSTLAYRNSYTLYFSTAYALMGNYLFVGSNVAATSLSVYNLSSTLRLWSFKVPLYNAYSAPYLTLWSGTLFAVANGGYLYAFDLKNVSAPTIRWNITLPFVGASGLTVTGNGMVVVLGDSKLYRVIAANGYFMGRSNSTGLYNVDGSYRGSVFGGGSFADAVSGRVLLSIPQMVISSGETDVAKWAVSSQSGQLYNLAAFIAPEPSLPFPLPTTSTTTAVPTTTTATPSTTTTTTTTARPTTTTTTTTAAPTTTAPPKTTTTTARPTVISTSTTTTVPTKTTTTTAAPSTTTAPPKTTTTTARPTVISTTTTTTAPTKTTTTTTTTTTASPGGIVTPAPTAVQPLPCETLASLERCRLNVSCMFVNASCVARCPSGYVTCEATLRCALSASLCSQCPTSSVQCWDSSCASSFAGCPCMPPMTARCDNHVCVSDKTMCAKNCSSLSATPFQCWDYSCAASPTDCPCPSVTPIRCPGTAGCATTQAQCSSTCAIPTPVKCWNGNCAASMLGCPCNLTAPYRCGTNGLCYSTPADCPCVKNATMRCRSAPYLCSSNCDSTCTGSAVLCEDGSCASSLLACPCNQNATTVSPSVTINTGATSFDVTTWLRLAASVSYIVCGVDRSASVRIAWTVTAVNTLRSDLSSSSAVLAIAPNSFDLTATSVVFTVTATVSDTLRSVAVVTLSTFAVAPKISFVGGSTMSTSPGKATPLAVVVTDRYSARQASVQWGCSFVNASTTVASLCSPGVIALLTPGATNLIVSGLVAGRYSFTASYAGVSASQNVIVSPGDAPRVWIVVPSATLFATRSIYLYASFNATQDVSVMWYVNGAVQTTAQRSVLIIAPNTLNAGATYNVTVVIQSATAGIGFSSAFITPSSLPKVSCTVRSATQGSPVALSSTIRIDAVLSDAAAAGVDFAFGYTDLAGFGSNRRNVSLTQAYQDQSFLEFVAPASVALMRSNQSTVIEFYALLRVNREVTVASTTCSLSIHPPIQNNSAVVESIGGMLNQAQSSGDVAGVLSSASTMTNVAGSSTLPQVASALGSALMSNRAASLSSEQRSQVAQTLRTAVATSANVSEQDRRNVLSALTTVLQSRNGGSAPGTSDTAFNPSRDGQAVLDTIASMTTDGNATTVAESLSASVATSAELGVTQTINSGNITVAGVSRLGSDVDGRSLATSSGASLTVPPGFAAGALRVNETSVVSLSGTEYRGNPFGSNGLRGNQSLATVVDFSVLTDGSLVPVNNLATPLQIRLAVDRSGVNASSGVNVSCLYWDRTAGAWSSQGLTLHAYDVATSTATCNTTHLSAFGVITSPSSSTPPPTPPSASSSSATIVAVVVCLVVVGVIVAGVLYYRMRNNEGDGPKNKGDAVSVDLELPMLQEPTYLVAKRMECEL